MEKIWTVSAPRGDETGASPPMNPSESQVEALLLRDRALRSLARGLIADAHAAEDVAQEAWLAALQHGDGALSLPRWLTGVVRNLAGKRRRTEERRTRREHDSARPEADPSTAEILEREAARTKVVAVVLALEEPYRATVVLRYFENLPPRAIAKRHGVPVETVRTRQKRALEMLRARLDHEFGGERGAWCALLAPLARGTPSSPLGRIADSLPPLVTVAVMSTQAKVAGAAAGVALLALLLWNHRGSSEVAVAAPAPPPERAELHAPPRMAAHELVPVPPPERTIPSAPVPAPAALATVPEALGSLLVRVTWWDKTPAEAVRARVEPAWSAGNPSWRALEAVTDGEGTFRLERLPPGTALAVFDRSGGYGAEILAGREATLEVELERGFDVTGVVLDPAERPVGGAEVWLSYSFTFDSGSVVARTGADGRFRVRSCQGGSIGARAPRFAPSLLLPLRASEGGELALELVLMGPGGELSGTVLDPEGNPVPSALVLVGETRPGVRSGAGVPVGGSRSITGLRAPARETRTDAEGRYSVTGLDPGVQPVTVRAAGFAIERAEEEIFEHGSSTRDLVLAPGVDLVGRVVTSDGRPARAEVSSGIPVGWLAFLTTTDEDGRFRLEDLAPGEFEVSAEGQAGRASATLRGAAGETVVWEPVLARGGALRGVLVDERGAGVAGYFILVEDESPRTEDACNSLGGVKTDAEGRFLIEGLGQHAHRIEAHPLGPVLFPVALATGVFPEREDVRLQITSESRPSVWIAGTVVDASGEAVANAQVRPVNRAHRRSPTITTDGGGNFELGPYPPGTWQLDVQPPSGRTDVSKTGLGPRALGVGETWDCGTIVLEPR